MWDDFLLKITLKNQVEQESEQEIEAARANRPEIKGSFFKTFNSWVSRDVINFTGYQLQIDTHNLDPRAFS